MRTLRRHERSGPRKRKLRRIKAREDAGISFARGGFVSANGSPRAMESSGGANVLEKCCEMYFMLLCFQKQQYLMLSKGKNLMFTNFISFVRPKAVALS